MKYKYFYKSGLLHGDEYVFFSSHNSKPNNIHSPYESIFRLPWNVYKEYFQYNKHTGIYQCSPLRYYDIKEYALYWNKRIDI